MELYNCKEKKNKYNSSEISILTRKQSNDTRSINLKGVGNSVLKS